jgi:hypothetical protein
MKDWLLIQGFKDWEESTFLTLKKDWEESNRGKAAKKLYETPTRMWWITKTRQSCHLCGLPQLTMGLGANSGKP